jgi:ParB-like chromosome segregation protein Spo0J
MPLSTDDDRRETTVRLQELRTGFSPRRGLDPRTVQAFVAAQGDWPAIVVHRQTMTVVDGTHRVVAARRLGLAEVAAVFFDGSAEDARLEAIRANVADGSGLTLAERKQAGSLVLTWRFSWSDRRIAAFCGLSAKTVVRLRNAHVREVEIADAVREGRDGRRRPTSRQDLHQRIAHVLQELPEASLRAVAMRADASPETVRAVRNQILRARPAERPAVEPRRAWTSDASFLATPEGLAFATWFEAHDVTRAQARAHLPGVPADRVDAVITEIKRRDVVWAEFAAALGRRVAPPARADRPRAPVRTAKRAGGGESAAVWSGTRGLRGETAQEAAHG